MPAVAACALVPIPRAITRVRKNAVERARRISRERLVLVERVRPWDETVGWLGAGLRGRCGGVECL